MDTDYLALALEYLDADIEDVSGYAVRDGEFSILLDFGIGGIKKYTIPLSDLDAIIVPAPKLSGMKKAELQEIAEGEGIDTDGLTVKQLIEAIEDAWGAPAEDAE